MLLVLDVGMVYQVFVNTQDANQQETETDDIYLTMLLQVYRVVSKCQRSKTPSVGY